MGEKAQYTQKGHKTLKIEIFHSHPCGFYIKNRPFAIEMAVWGLGLLLLSAPTSANPIHLSHAIPSEQKQPVSAQLSEANLSQQSQPT